MVQQRIQLGSGGSGVTGAGGTAPRFPVPGNQQQLQHPSQGGGGGGAAAAAAAGPRCSHGMPYAACTHKQQHLDEITREVADAAMQMADAEGQQLQGLQQEVKRLRALKQLIEAGASPHVGAVPGPHLQQQGGMAAAPHQRQVGAGPAAYSSQQQQQPSSGGGNWGQAPQPQQQWNGASSGGGPGAGQQYGAQPAGGGYGAGPGSGRMGGAAPGPSYQAPGGGSFGGSASYGGGGGGGYEQGPPPPLWEQDKSAMQNVRAEREDATNSPQ